MNKPMTSLTHGVLTGLLIAAMLLGVGGCATSGTGTANVPSLVLQDYRGASHCLTDYIGRKVVVMSFWATWCQPCRQELGMLEQLYRNYKDDGLMVLAINTDGPETQGEVRNLVVQQGFTFPVLLDTETRVVSIYNPRKQEPMMHIFDRSGRIVFTHATFQPGEAASLKAKILSVLHATGDDDSDSDGKRKSKRGRRVEDDNAEE